LDFGWSCNPSRRLELLADYMPVWANTNPLRGQTGYSVSGRFRGHLITGILKYTLSEHLTGHLWSEVFLPGSYYAPDRRDLTLFLRAELLWKF
jgi:hypothetical protein